MNAASSEAPAFKPPPRDPRLTELLREYPAEVFSERLYQSIELMERYSIELAINLLRELGVLDHIDEWQSCDNLCHALGFQPRFRFALGWLLERVVETECIEAQSQDGSRCYRLRQIPWAADLARLRELAMEIDHGNAATLDLLDHAASIYPAVARGEQRGEQSLFGPKGIALWLGYFNNTNSTYAVNNWVGTVAAAQRIGSGKSLRILEVGAGAGSATQTLLHWLDQDGFLPKIERYLVTEPNAFFRRRAQRDVGALYPNLRLEWATLDINEPWQHQILPTGEFDLVFAVNVLHVSKDLLFSLKQAVSVLSPGGWLVLGECVRPYPNQPIYPELMFQNLESFIDVQTDAEVRPRPGFLTPEQWRAAFRRAGLSDCEVSPDIEKIRDIYSHFFTAAIAGQRK
jgi:SAM-dependent methyltransferase